MSHGVPQGTGCSGLPCCTTLVAAFPQDIAQNPWRYSVYSLNSCAKQSWECVRLKRKLFPILSQSKIKLFKESMSSFRSKDIVGMLFQIMGFMRICFKRWPWLVWLSSWVPACKSKGCWFHSQPRAHAWVAGQVPRRGRARGNHTLMFPSFSPSLPLSKKQINKIF